MADKKTKMFSLLITDAQYAHIVKAAAERALATGKPTSAADILRELAFGDQREAQAPATA